jgi:hypothetical protein
MYYPYANGVRYAARATFEEAERWARSHLRGPYEIVQD